MKSITKILMAISLLLSSAGFAQDSTEKQTHQLAPVFENYFALKDALVKTNGTAASAKANDLTTALGALNVESLTSEVHAVWIKVRSEIEEDAGHIADTKDIKHQRDHFSTLSKNIYSLVKVSKAETPIYSQHCPMYNSGKGADWLSKESTIKNPYYGSQMLTCGKTVETIK